MASNNCVSVYAMASNNCTYILRVWNNDVHTCIGVTMASNNDFYVCTMASNGRYLCVTRRSKITILILYTMASNNDFFMCILCRQMTLVMFTVWRQMTPLGTNEASLDHPIENNFVKNIVRSSLLMYGDRTDTSVTHSL